MYRTHAHRQITHGSQDVLTMMTVNGSSDLEEYKRPCPIKQHINDVTESHAYISSIMKDVVSHIADMGHISVAYTLRYQPINNEIIRVKLDEWELNVTLAEARDPKLMSNVCMRSLKLGYDADSTITYRPSTFVDFKWALESTLSETEIQDIESLNLLVGVFSDNIGDNLKMLISSNGDDRKFYLGCTTHDDGSRGLIIELVKRK